LGRSNRDFDFLIETWNEINESLVIISDTYQGVTKNPKITIKRNVTGEDQYPWVAHCKALILPIDDGRICSGDTVLLTAMSFAKTPIVTTPSTLAEMYIQDHINGILVKKNSSEFVSLINNLKENDLNKIGKNARNSFLENYSRESMGRTVMKAIKQNERIHILCQKKN
jgi:glycosyltransferase involved in cell wall biosynthesis